MYRLFKEEIVEYIGKAASGEMTPCRTLTNVLFGMLREFYCQDTQILHQSFKILHNLRSSNPAQNMRLNELLSFIDRRLDPSNATDMAVFIQNAGLIDALDYIGTPLQNHIIGLFSLCCSHLGNSEVAENYELSAFEHLTEFHLRLMSYFCNEYLISPELNSVYAASIERISLSVTSMHPSKVAMIGRQTSDFFKRFSVDILRPLLQYIENDPSDDMKKLLFAKSIEHVYTLLRHDLELLSGSARSIPNNMTSDDFFNLYLKSSRQCIGVISFVKSFIADLAPLLFQAIEHFYTDTKFIVCLQRVLNLLAAFLTNTNYILPIQNYRVKFILRIISIRIKR